MWGNHDCCSMAHLLHASTQATSVAATTSTQASEERGREACVCSSQSRLIFEEDQWAKKTKTKNFRNKRDKAYIHTKSRDHPSYNTAVHTSCVYSSMDTSLLDPSSLTPATWPASFHCPRGVAGVCWQNALVTTYVRMYVCGRNGACFRNAKPVNIMCLEVPW